MLVQFPLFLLGKDHLGGHVLLCESPEHLYEDLKTLFQLTGTISTTCSNDVRMNRSTCQPVRFLLRSQVVAEAGITLLVCRLLLRLIIRVNACRSLIEIRILLFEPPPQNSQPGLRLHRVHCLFVLLLLLACCVISSC
jgi:hypothetical protein